MCLHCSTANPSAEAAALLIPSQREATYTPNSSVRKKRRRRHQTLCDKIKQNMTFKPALSVFRLTSTINRHVHFIYDYDSAQAFTSCFVEYKFAETNKLFFCFPLKVLFSSPEVCLLSRFRNSSSSP
ncbi:hypothetical protein FQA47_009725 [Oryzias melastigma]|uniref:Uncharacterized protein n=1 Tax=Oryzias melastigma TaxID=30732 RepID=A0A834C3G7_ORYME|nr:hypothetical protein FQA47_009725 [Oryzias melastigma]